MRGAPSERDAITLRDEKGEAQIGLRERRLEVQARERSEPVFSVIAVVADVDLWGASRSSQSPGGQEAPSPEQETAAHARSRSGSA